MAANKFVLKGSGIEVDYAIGITPGIPALIFKGEALERSFTSGRSSLMIRASES